MSPFSECQPAPRIVAFYLPQFHPVPENDRWWGKGFTEWTNTAKATPMFRGHYQPHVPADLGFYDLRVPETRIAQAEMAREYGIEAFCYYHYWFAGRRMIERPFNEVLASKQPDFPFCLCWANQTWSGVWHGAPDRILIEQTYPGLDDHRAHFETLLEAFRDPRYMTVDGKPVFVLYAPSDIPDVVKVIDFWRELAVTAGLRGLHMVSCGHHPPGWNPGGHGFDAVTIFALPERRPWVSRRRPVTWLKRQYDDTVGRPTVYSYAEILPHLLPEPIAGLRNYPTVIPGWDNTPRSGKNGLVLHGATPELFRIHVRQALDRVRGTLREHNLVFVKSWNEWAEGNHLEPDLKFGRGYLEVIRSECS